MGPGDRPSLHLPALGRGWPFRCHRPAERRLLWRQIAAIAAPAVQEHDDRLAAAGFFPRHPAAAGDFACRHGIVICEVRAARHWSPMRLVQAFLLVWQQSDDAVHHRELT